MDEERDIIDIGASAQPNDDAAEAAAAPGPSEASAIPGPELERITADVIKALNSTTFETPLGPFGFDEQGNWSRTGYVIYVVRNGEFVAQ